MAKQENTEKYYIVGPACNRFTPNAGQKEMSTQDAHALAILTSVSSSISRIIIKMVEIPAIRVMV